MCWLLDSADKAQKNTDKSVSGSCLAGLESRMYDHKTYEKLLHEMKTTFTKTDMIWVLLIASVVFTVFFFRLLWNAPDITTAFTFNYLCNDNNLCQLAICMGFPLSLYLIIRFLFKR